MTKTKEGENVLILHQSLMAVVKRKVIQDHVLDQDQALDLVHLDQGLVVVRENQGLGLGQEAKVGLVLEVVPLLRNDLVVLGPDLVVLVLKSLVHKVEAPQDHGQEVVVHEQVL